jgi:hypothetical protein
MRVRPPNPSKIKTFPAKKTRSLQERPASNLLSVT